jgi:hypothetical protein
MSEQTFIEVAKDEHGFVMWERPYTSPTLRETDTFTIVNGHNFLVLDCSLELPGRKVETLVRYVQTKKGG